MLWPAMESFMSSIQLFCLHQLKPKNPKQPLEMFDVAVGAGSFKTLVSIVSDLGLVDTLKGAEALTI